MHDELPDLKSAYYPPRAGLWASVAGGGCWVSRRLFGIFSAVSGPMPWQQTLLAVVVPGMGFEVYGRRLIAWLVFSGWALGGLMTSLLLASPPQQFLLFQFEPAFLGVGLMTGMHATSVSYFAQRFWGWTAPPQRMLLSIAVTGLLLLVIYLPLVRILDSYRTESGGTPGGFRFAAATPVEAAPDRWDRSHG